MPMLRRGLRLIRHPAPQRIFTVELLNVLALPPHALDLFRCRLRRFLSRFVLFHPAHRCGMARVTSWAAPTVRASSTRPLRVWPKWRIAFMRAWKVT